MAKRNYHFPLPYSIPGPAAVIGRGRLQAAHVFEQLPAQMQDELNAAGFFHGVTVTADELDKISDPTWTKIATALGLAWSAAAIVLLILLTPDAALAADGTSVGIPYGDTINQILEAVRNSVLLVIAALATWAGRSLPGIAGDFIKMAIANRWLDRAVDFGFNTTEGALKGKTVTVEVGSVVAANALAYITQHGPAWLLSWLGGHADDIKDRLLARIPTEQGASLATAVGGTVADTVVQPTTPAAI